MSAPIAMSLRVTIDSTHKRLCTCGQGEELELASVSLAVLQESAAAQTAWRTLVAEAIAAAEAQAAGDGP